MTALNSTAMCQHSDTVQCNVIGNSKMTQPISCSFNAPLPYVTFPMAVATIEPFRMLRSLCVIDTNLTILRHFLLNLWCNESFRYFKSTLYMIYYIYLLTAIGFSPGGRSTLHIYTQTIHRLKQNKQYLEHHSN
jgi:hypothetical protein